MRGLLGMCLLPLLAACGQGGSQGASDCGDVGIRVHGTVYLEVGSVPGPAQPAGRAEVSSCDDMGEDPRGLYFTDHPGRVGTWSFEGQDPGTVLGVLRPDNSFAVFVAEGHDHTTVMKALRRLQQVSER